MGQTLHVMNRTGHNANRFGRATPGARSSGIAARHDQVQGGSTPRPGPMPTRHYAKLRQITLNYAELRQVTVFCEQPPLRVALNCTKLHLIAVILKRPPGAFTVL